MNLPDDAGHLVAVELDDRISTLIFAMAGDRARRAAARREYRHGGARHGQFRPVRTAARQSARRLAEREGARRGQQGRPRHRRVPWSSTRSRRPSPTSTSSMPRRRACATASSRCARAGRRGQGAENATMPARRSGILFGREKSGLYNEEVALADEIVTFPVNPAFASLNIAQAVLLMSYEWMKSGLDNETDTAVFAGRRIRRRPRSSSSGPVRPSGGGARHARLFPPGAQEAEDGRQSARRADADR
jgi:hypothetical protein